MELENPAFVNLDEYLRKRLIDENCSMEMVSSDLKALFPNESGFRCVCHNVCFPVMYFNS
jgi:hypothetical protein